MHEYDAVRVPLVSARSRAEIEKRAELSLHRVAPRCLVEPGPAPVTMMFDTLLYRAGWKPVIKDLAPGMEGMTDCVSREVTLAPHVYEGMEAGQGHDRFTGGHEIGHVILHAPELATRVGVLLQNGGAVLLAKHSEMKRYRDPEWQANTYAAALLMPAAMVRLLVSRVHPHQRVDAMMEAFQVSRESANYRLYNLGL